MSEITGEILRAMAREVASRPGWDEPPGLYYMYLLSGRCRLSLLGVPRRLWAAGPPARVLLALAGTAGHGGLLRPASPAALHGVAFMSEAWRVVPPPGAEETRRALADQQAGRLHARPDRVEIRMMWAVDRSGMTYVASLDRAAGTAAQQAYPPGGADAVGDIPDALDQMVRALLGTRWPDRPAWPG